MKLKDTFNNHNGAVLGVLEGDIADIVQPTRNGRRYTEELWEKTFNDDIVNELIENGGIVGELDHPTDRSETDTSRAAILLREKPVKGSNGKLRAKFDILNTPMGNIAYTLAKAGFNFGVSSRGDGDVRYDDATGEEIVNEDTYEFKAFDLVLVPAVKSARLSLISESYQPQGTYIRAINEMLSPYSKFSEDEKKLITETLDNLKINYKSQNKESGNIVEPTKESNKVSDTKLDEILESLQTTLIKKTNLESQVLELQEKLAVSDTQVDKAKEELTKYKDSTRALSNKVVKLKESIKELKESDERKDLLIEKLQNKQPLQERLNKSIEHKNNSILKLREQLREVKKGNEEEINKLQEQLKNYKTDSKLLESKLNTRTSQLEDYKKITTSAINKYIDLKSSITGISSDTIKAHLNESFSIDDIDKVCDNLQTRKLNISKLPFNLQKNTKINIKESLNETTYRRDFIEADIVDDDLRDLLR